MITEVRGPSDWRGDDIAASPLWRYPLSPAHQAEVLAAMDRPNFPLSTLDATLAAVREELVHGRGFALLQGIPVDGLSERDAETVALGIAGHIGRIVPQDGERFKHVRDQGVDPAAATSRSYQHNGRLGYHSDPTDVVALLCVRPAKEGGLSSVVSSVAVHDEIVRSRPELAQVLYEPWWRDRRTGDGPDSFYQSPVYSRTADGGLLADYGPDYLRSAQRGAHVPPLRPVQLAAMAELDRYNDDFALTMDLKAGDMQFLNNHVTMHGRTEYVDHPEPTRRRDLIRLWLDVS